jgi:hypothetical protein
MYAPVSVGQRCELSGYTGRARAYALGAMSRELVGTEREATRQLSFAQTVLLRYLHLNQSQMPA